MYIGTAGWTIPKQNAEQLSGEGSHLQRYARVLRAAEINSSFHRPHARKVYERWAAGVPPGFLFSVKIPRTITHDLKLRRARAPLEQFLEESGGLGDKRGPLLVQLPPSFAFDARVAGRFIELLRARYEGDVAWEPRHPTWFEGRADRLLAGARIARVAADPDPCRRREPGDLPQPGGWDGLTYFRMHGSPRTYWSRYEPGYIEALARALPPGAWCIFDNTAGGFALTNALELQKIGDRPRFLRSL